MICLMLFIYLYTFKSMSLIIYFIYKANHLMHHRLIPQSNLVNSLISMSYDHQNQSQDSLHLIISIASYTLLTMSLNNLKVCAIDLKFISLLMSSSYEVNHLAFFILNSIIMQSQVSNKHNIQLLSHTQGSKPQFVSLTCLKTFTCMLNFRVH